MAFRSLAAVAAVLAATMAPSMPAFAQPAYNGFMCCNLRTDGSWASDSNYAESGKHIIAVGTPVQVTGYGRNRVNVVINGAKQDIGNDYSRDLDLGAFAQRWVVTQNPNAKIAGFAPRVREAIRSARIAKGMTREQVFMAVGYPISSENPNLNAGTLRYWISSFGPFTVHFDRAGRVRDVETDPQTRAIVVMN